MNTFLLKFKEKWSIVLFIVMLTIIVMVVFMYRNRQHNKEAASFKEEYLPAEVKDNSVVETSSEETEEEIGSEKNILSNTKDDSVSTVTLDAGKLTQQAASKAKEKYFAVQIASFKEQKRAQVLVNELVKQSYSPYIIAKNIEGKGEWYRVCVGKFDTKNKADEVLVTIKEKYKNSFVTLL